MAHIVVLGAGTGGMPAAYELRDLLGAEHEITVVNEQAYFQFMPSNPWIAVGWRDRSATTFDIEPHLHRRGINFIARRCTHIDPLAGILSLDGGESLAYDYLVIATGPRLAFEEVEGSDPEQGYCDSVCTLDHAEATRVRYSAFLEDPGPVVLGAMPHASCFGPAYELAFILDTDLRRRKLRERVPITYVTPEPYIGHLGLGGVGDSQGLLEEEMRNHQINWITNARVTRVGKGWIWLDECDPAGGLLRQHQLPFRLSVMLPAFRGAGVVAAVEGLCDARGFVLVDAYQRSPRYSNIYAAGVCIAIPPVEATVVPTCAPKTGYMIETMVAAIVQNINAQLQGKAPYRSASWSAVCLADMGDTGAAFVALPQNPPRRLAWIKKGKWVHMAKIAFEKYFILKMKRGTSEPVYQKYILKMLGINRLQ